MRDLGLIQILLIKREAKSYQENKNLKYSQALDIISIKYLNKKWSDIFNKKHLTKNKVNKKGNKTT